MKQLLIIALLLSFTLTSCVVDSDDPKPDSTHVLIITVDKVTANGACTQDGAEINTEIELYISTREEGTPSRADAKKEYEPLIFTAFETESPNFTLETDFALEDQVLVEARIKTTDDNHAFSPKEEFWHGSYYNSSQECWIDDRWLNVFVAPGCHDGGVEFIARHETSMAYGSGCQVWYEWTVKVERL